jgi:hypothetical protein
VGTNGIVPVGTSIIGTYPFVRIADYFGELADLGLLTKELYIGVATENRPKKREVVLR